MRPRGYVLVFGLAALTTMFAAVMLLSRGMFSRGAAQRSAHGRELALQNAENALELARVQLERGELKPGSAARSGEINVSCAQSPSGNMRLEARATVKQRTAKKSTGVQRAVRVSWELKPGPASAWSRVNWTVRDESVAP
ncbi:MAG TPA: hypothetical protein VEK08_24760 [Planctomycetota bacterium]|nr:hypothetical protein [Planctomycetota bacterium]